MVGRTLLHYRITGAPHQLTRFENDAIFSFAYSTDGTLLATARGRSSGDVVLIKNFR